tara:strand:- start:722 stop:925 length:204 start_codon:yes stop_codon:yes gene_type:complete
MSILTTSKQGKTLIGAAMELFNKKSHKDIKHKLICSTIAMISVYNEGVWVDYDYWVDGDTFNFLAAE